MAEAVKDPNMYPTMIAASSSDGKTPVNVKVGPTEHSLQVEDDTTGSDLSGEIASRDNNGYPVMMGVSSDDGETPTAVYANDDGELLIDST